MLQRFNQEFTSISPPRRASIYLSPASLPAWLDLFCGVTGTDRLSPASNTEQTDRNDQPSRKEERQACDRTLPQFDQDTSGHVLFEPMTQRIVGQSGLKLLAPDPAGCFFLLEPQGEGGEGGTGGCGMMPRPPCCSGLVSRVGRDLSVPRRRRAGDVRFALRCAPRAG